MAHITFDYSKVLDKFVAPHEVEYMQAQGYSSQIMLYETEQVPEQK